MKANEIKVSSMRTASECYTAIDAIQNNYRNVVGGHRAFFSGKQTYLTQVAEKKVKALEAKATSFPDYED